MCAHGTVGSRDWPANVDPVPSGATPGANTVARCQTRSRRLAAAVDAGFECVEVDVSRTKDGHLVALHSRDAAAPDERGEDVEGEKQEEGEEKLGEAERSYGVARHRGGYGGWW